MTTHAEEFLAAHPYYDPDHVAYIAARKAEDGTPYCQECQDWHFPNEDHSMMEDK